MVEQGIATMKGWLMSLPDQIRSALIEARENGWPTGDLKGDGPVFVGGMGGSAIAGRLASAILGLELGFPLVVQADPTLPRWVGKGHRVVLVSYSGNTWEVAELAEAARERGIDPWIIAGGGALEAVASPGRFFRTELGMAPRAALGWTLTPMLLLLARMAGGSAEQELLDSADLLEEEVDLWDEGGAHPGRAPEALARFLIGRTPFFMVESALLGPLATRWRCQLHENAKRFAGECVLPESVHNEIEGWPDQAKLESPCVVRIEGPDHARGKRALVLEAARQELESLGFDFLTVPAYGDGRMERLLSQVLLGDRVSLELARLTGVDPVPVPAIDRLKRAVASGAPTSEEEKH